MEVHAPTKPILTLKEAAVHLCIVTAGILIALSLEGMLEGIHHRSLVREARLNLTAELKNNQAELDRLLGEFGTMQQNLERGIAALDAVSTGRVRGATASAMFGPDSTSVIHAYDIAELSSASRTTAEMTGAFGLMDYTEVMKYTAAYNRQELYGRMQDQAFSSAIAAFSLGHGLNFENASPLEIEDVRSHLRLAVGNLIIETEIAGVLKKTYAKALSQ